MPAAAVIAPPGATPRSGATPRLPDDEPTDERPSSPSTPTGSSAERKHRHRHRSSSNSTSASPSTPTSARTETPDGSPALHRVRRKKDSKDTPKEEKFPSTEYKRVRATEDQMTRDAGWVSFLRGESFAVIGKYSAGNKLTGIYTAHHKGKVGKFFACRVELTTEAGQSESPLAGPARTDQLAFGKVLGWTRGDPKLAEPGSDSSSASRSTSRHSKDKQRHKHKHRSSLSRSTSSVSLAPLDDRENLLVSAPVPPPILDAGSESSASDSEEGERRQGEGEGE